MTEEEEEERKPASSENDLTTGPFAVFDTRDKRPMTGRARCDMHAMRWRWLYSGGDRLGRIERATKGDRRNQWEQGNSKGSERQSGTQDLPSRKLSSMRRNGLLGAHVDVR